MLRQSIKTGALWGVGLPIGIALLVSQSSAIAAPRANDYNSQTPTDIIIDTDSGQSVPPSPSPSDSSSADPRFSCQMNRGQYTVMYHAQTQNSTAYPWAVPSNLGDGWTAQRRCYEISRRLEFYRPDGLLELSTGRENNYNTICVTTQRDAGCRIVLTVPPGRDPEIIRDRVFQTLVAADEGQATAGVNAFNNNNSGSSILNQLGQLFNRNASPASGRADNGIDLRPFLAPSDGGTGAKLGNPSGSVAPSNPRTLNPDRFR